MTDSVPQGEDVTTPRSIVIVGAGVFGSYSLLNNVRYDQTSITVVDKWRPEHAKDDRSVTPASIDNSRIIRPDYASKAYARLGARAQNLWRSGWPLSLPVHMLGASTLPLNPACERVRKATIAQPYRESGLLLTSWDESSSRSNGSDTPPLLNPRGPGYVEESMSNMLSMGEWEPALKDRIDVCKTREAVSTALKTPGVAGDRGYLNRASGWADAGAAMGVLRNRVQELVVLRRVQGKAEASWLDGENGEAITLNYGKSVEGKAVVTGVRLSSGTDVEADLVVLSMGAWSPRLLPRSLGTRIKASGQVLGYVGLDATEAKSLSGMPVPLNLSTGLFAFPPIPDGHGNFVLKVARHGWGYDYATRVPDLESASPSVNEDIEVHLPSPGSGVQVPEEGSNVLRQFLREIGGPDKPWLMTRTCWYADTATGDWLIDYVPTYHDGSLFVATGGSGHAYKFAPVLGDWIVKAIERRLEKVQEGAGNETDGDLGTMLRQSWRWRTAEEDASNWVNGSDGSRGGPQGMTWADEIARGAVRGTAA